MALYENIRHASAGRSLAGRVSTALASVFSALTAWNDARVTRNSLDQLTDRELDDIGLSRGDIDRIASRLAR